MASFEDYLHANKTTFESKFFDILRIPSVSAIESHSPDMRAAATWFHSIFTEIGLAAELIETGDGPPLVYGETPKVDGAPIILIYGHYDVQPPDPLPLWKTPPFEPTVRDGNVFARGATDDKGQFLTHVFSLESILHSYHEAGKPLPFQVKLIAEGEEEVGSAGLHRFIETAAGQKKLASDCILVSDTSMFSPGQPTITYGLRGIVAFELFLTGPNRDLHSGTFGGCVFNPATALVKILSQFVNDVGVVGIPLFYEDVLPLTERETAELNSLPFDEGAFLDRIGLSEGFGEVGYSTIERRWARPTFDINGLTSGYQGEGSKTIIPSKASAKFTCRLVPNQKPDVIAASVRSMIASLIPPGIQWELDVQHGASGMHLDLDKSRFVDIMSSALEKTFSCAPVFTREGGSIPIVAELSEKLAAEVLLVGWGQDDDNLHSPNEKFSLASFHAGSLASAHFLADVGRRIRELSQKK
ncbi:MAG: dipeptidase [Thermoguttaceae bacterium]